MTRLRNPSEDAVYFEDARCKAETPKAILVKIDTRDGKKEVWVPKSQVHDDSEIAGRDDEGTLAITEWFAEKEGLEP